MATAGCGESYGDAIVFALTFAEQAPVNFMLTVPLTLALSLCFGTFISKYVVLGPITHHIEGYRDKRAQTKQSSKKSKGSK